MHFQSLLTFSIVLLAGTSIAAEGNGGEVPQMLRKGRAKLRASDLLSGSSSANIGGSTPASLPTPTGQSFSIPTPSVSASAVNASSLAIPSSSAATFASSLFPSSFQSSPRPSIPSSSASVHRPAMQGTHVVQHPAVTNAAGSGASDPPAGDAGLPVSAIANNMGDNKNSHAPFWIKDAPKPNAPDFSNAPDASIGSKDGCSVRCNDLASQCAELLPHNQDFCFQQFPRCQDLCVKEHVG